MFKNMKKLTAILLSAIMILSTMTTVFAEELPEGAVQTEATNAITEQSEALSVKSGETATFTVKANGKIRSYRWEVSKDGGKKWNKLDAKTDTLSIEARTENDGDLYRCAVTFKNYKVAYSEPAKLNVAPVTLSETVSLENVSVDANYDREAFSEAVELGAEVLNEEDAKYAEAADALAEAGYNYENMMALDIHFLSQLTGAEVEPDGDVDISINLNKDLLGEDVDRSSIMISHITEKGVEIISGFVSEPEPELPGDDNGAGLLKVDFTAKSFSTYTISWYYQYNRQYNIHYVDTTGASLTPTRTPTFTYSYNFLIYDIEGYEYDSTHYGSRTGTSITPLLRTDDYNDKQYRSGNNWNDLRNDIYVVYKAKTAPTPGGVVAPPADQEWPTGDDAPKFQKDSTNNGDGTNTITLSVSAGEKTVENKTRANVIVVFDVSGSMKANMAGEYNADWNGQSYTSWSPSSQQRLSIAKTAVKNMATTLTTGDKAGLVDLALVEFSTTASRRGSWTTNANTFSGNTYVDGMAAGGGTNWEHGLSEANRIANNDSGAATFIIFVTDGDPTFRLSRGDVSDANLDMYTGSTYQFYRNNSIFGNGQTDPQDRNFDAAVEEVKSILAQGKNFYAIGVSSDVQQVENLCTDAGVDSSHAFLATNEEALNNAFDQIVSSITSALGFGDMQLTDGITELSTTEMEVLEEVDPASFTYYRIDSTGKHEWTTRESDGCGPATYDKATGVVNWNMGEGFQLEDGVTYQVTFRVWPSQAAYDLVADLNNGIKTYASLTDAQKAQVVALGTNPETYALKTNTDNVSASYKKTTKTGDVVSIADDEPIGLDVTYGTSNDMALASLQLSIKKTFNDTLTAAEDRETQVTLILQRRITGEGEFVNYPVPQANGVMSAEIVLSEANDWTYSFYVAPGLMAEGEVLEKGYEFTLTEPNIDYHYDLNGEIINPMVVDGTPTFVGDGQVDQDGNGIVDPEVIARLRDQMLTADNVVKGGIDVKKVVVDADGNEIVPVAETFTIKGKILDPNGDPYTFDPAWDDRTDKSTATGASETWLAHQNDTGAYHQYDQAGNRTIYKGHFASTDDITLTLKANEYVRFVNVPKGSTFEFYEVTTGMPVGYEFLKIEGANFTRGEPTGVDEQGKPILAPYEPYTSKPGPEVSADGKTVTGTVYGNVSSQMTITNKTVSGEYFYVYHSSDKTIEKVYTTDARVTKGEYNEENKTYAYTFNMVNEVKKGYLYGGYFSTFGGAGLTDAQIIDLAYAENGTKSAGVYADEKATGFWATDTDGTAYTGAQAGAWKKGYTVSGFEASVESGKVYYLKEIPEEYFRPALYYVYDDRAEGKPILKLYFLLPTDDGYYLNVGGVTSGFDLATSKKLYSKFTVTPFEGEDEVITVKTANSKLSRGYLAVWEMNDLLVANKTYTWKPFFVTKDNVKVTSITTRTITTGSLGFGSFDATDERTGSTASAAN